MGFQRGFELNTSYQCPGEVSFKVISCAGPNSTDQCLMNTIVAGSTIRSESSRGDIAALMSRCRVQSALETQSANRGGNVTELVKDANGFRIGEVVQVDNGKGWTNGRIVAINGNDYRVSMPDRTEVIKIYPVEVRRLGALTERDRALGLFNLQEKVQVLADGKEEVGVIIAMKGMDYQVQFAPGRTVWANGRILLLAPNAPTTAAVSTNRPDPPRAGLTSCSGKVEGQYVVIDNETGDPRIDFAGGKALMRVAGNDEALECWMEGDKIYLHRPGSTTDRDALVEVLPNGALKTSAGELRKPPRPGLTSCSRKVEGRYLADNEAANPRIDIAGIKAVMNVAGRDETFECWIDGTVAKITKEASSPIIPIKIYLHRSGSPADRDLPLELLPYGALKTPVGELWKPPRPGLRTCSGKIEGKYAADKQTVETSIEFALGKALMRAAGREDIFECWIEGSKILLHRSGPASGRDEQLEVLANGVLKTPVGELRKK
jgi:hypothetical protein